MPILYTASSRSLAILETLAHLTNGIKPPRLVLLKIYLPDEEVKKIETNDLPLNWNKKGYYPDVQEYGMEWLESRSSLAISVPSVISKDPIILVNPQHPGFAKVKVTSFEESFLIDDRLL
jgi:RES domain-containing protein